MNSTQSLDQKSIDRIEAAITRRGEIRKYTELRHSLGVSAGNPEDKMERGYDRLNRQIGKAVGTKIALRVKDIDALTDMILDLREELRIAKHLAGAATRTAEAWKGLARMRGLELTEAKDALIERGGNQIMVPAGGATN